MSINLLDFCHIRLLSIFSQVWEYRGHTAVCRKIQEKCQQLCITKEFCSYKLGIPLIIYIRFMIFLKNYYYSSTELPTTELHFSLHGQFGDDVKRMFVV